MDWIINSLAALKPSSSHMTGVLRVLWNMYPLLLLFLHPMTTVSGYQSGYYTDNGYQTMSRRHLQNWQEQENAIGKELLSMLGIEKTPKVRPGEKYDQSAPLFMTELYRQLQYDSIDQWERAHNLDQIHFNLSLPGLQGAAGDADLIMSFQNKASHSSASAPSQHYQFDFSDVPNTESVSRAELRLYKQPTPTTRGSTVSVTVYNIHKDERNTSLERIRETRVSSSFEGWIDFDVTDSVKQWLDWPQTNNGFHVTFTDHQGSVLSAEHAGVATHSQPQRLQTFMVAFFHAPQTGHVRQRRSADKEQPRKRSGNSRELSHAKNGEINGNYYSYSRPAPCHKEALFIRFSDLGWENWVIAPEGYAAYHCTGQCSFPLNAHMNATNHAIVQTLVSLMEPGKVPLPCCAPTKMSAISVLYFDNKSNVILKRYKNMVVKSCGCQ